MTKTLIKSCRILRLCKEENGQDLVEYTLLGALIAVACVATMSSLAGAIQTAFGTISAAL